MELEWKMINENYGIDKRIFTSADAPWICELLKRNMIFVHIHNECGISSLGEKRNATCTFFLYIYF
jgi:hypothetical protein